MRVPHAKTAYGQPRAQLPILEFPRAEKKFSLYNSTHKGQLGEIQNLGLVAVLCPSISLVYGQRFVHIVV